MSLEIRSYFNIYGKFISDEKGYGVFSREFIPKNSLIEVSYVVPSNHNEWQDYLFGIAGFLPLGFGCIYNHSDTPNIEWKETKESNIIHFISSCDINIGDELCHNYGKHWWNSRTDKKMI